MRKTATSKLFPKSPFVRAIGTLVSGTVAGQALVIIASPVLTRLYTPDEFGVLAIYTALLGLLLVVATLRYELAIPLPKSDRTAANLLMLSLMCLAAVTSLTTVLLFFFGSRALSLIGAHEFYPYLWLVPVAVVLVGAYQIFNAWALRKQAFRRVAGTQIQQGAGMVVVQVGLGVVQLGPVGLLLGHIAGQAAGVLNLVRLALRKEGAFFQRMDLVRVRSVASRYRRFPLYSTWEALANTISNNLPLLLLPVLFGPAVAGLFLLAQRVMVLPMRLVGQAVARVFHVRGARARQEQALSELVLNTFSGLARLSVGPMLVLVVVASDLFALLFGEGWRLGGVLVQFMVPWIMINFISSPLSMLFVILEEQKAGLVFQVLLLGSRLVAMFFAVPLGPVACVAAYSLASFMVYLGSICWLMNAADVRPKKWLSVLQRELVAGVVVAVALWWMVDNVREGVSPGLASFFILIMALIAVFGLLLWRVVPFVKNNSLV